MKEKISSNYKIASYLIIISAAVDIVVGIFESSSNPAVNLTTIVETSLMFIIFGYFIMLEKNWIKWLILFTTTFVAVPLITTVIIEGEINALRISQLFSILIKSISILFLFMI